VAVGSEVQRHQVGDRALVQTDYRHMLTAGSNASFGYNFEGALQQYTLMDERVIIDPQTQERFLIPVSEEPSASAVGLLEPWACVERAYATEERGMLATGGKLLVVADSGRVIEGLPALIEMAPPASIIAVVADSAQQAALESLGTTFVDSLEDLAAGSFDDIIYFGSDPRRV
jgi:NADPH:quinone reductase-like Zn-dependent oxidoreductase